MFDVANRLERNQRRLIDISPVEMLAAGQIIKLIPKNAVAVRREQMKNQFRADQIENQRFDGEKLRCRSCIHVATGRNERQ